MYKIFTRKICTPLGYITNFLPQLFLALGQLIKRDKKQWLMRIKITSFIFFITLLQVSAAGLAQRITFSQKDATLKHLFTEINKQTGYNVFWSPKLVNNTIRINVNFNSTPLEEVLQQPRWTTNNVCD